MPPWSERKLIERIRQACKGSVSGLVTSMGDDCCEVRSDASFLISTDTLVDSIHFDCNFHPPHLLGRKSIAVNLSDIAAMGGRPRFVLLSLSLPEELSWEWITAWLDGVFEILREHSCFLIGGDTVKSHELAFAVTVLGEPVGGGAIYRNGAEMGDTVWVSGPLGSAGAGLELLRHQSDQKLSADSRFDALYAAHLNPIPMIALGQELVRSELVTSMQDISDGLATDLAHICKSSGVAARVFAEQLPCHPELQVAADLLNVEAEDLLLRAGEDYQLVFTVRKGQEVAFIQLMQESAPGVCRVGEIVSGEGVFLQKKFHSEEISFQGFEH